MASDMEAVGAMVGDAWEDDGAVVRKADDASEEVDVVMDGAARMLLTRLASTSAIESPAMFPLWLSQQVAFMLFLLRGQKHPSAQPLSCTGEEANSMNVK